jgi:hypothetical protein
MAKISFRTVTSGNVFRLRIRDIFADRRAAGILSVISQDSSSARLPQSALFAAEILRQASGARLADLRQ